MNSENLELIRRYLEAKGMTFEPLRDEMLDHISSDIERLMQKGSSFEDAWQKVVVEIPPKQLHTIQIETMETISKKQNLSRWFAYLSFFLLFAGSAFKLLKFPGAGDLLIASFYSIIISLLSGSIFGIYHSKDKNGGWLLLGIVAGIGIFLISMTFQVLNLPGATELRHIGVAGLCILYPLSYVLLKTGHATILPHLHEKYTPSIERFIMILFGAVVIMRIPSLLLQYNDAVSRVLLVILITALGFQFFSVMWHRDEQHRPSWMETVVIGASFISFLLPALASVFSLEIRAIMAAIFFASAGLIALGRSRQDGRKPFVFTSIAFVVVLHVVWALSVANFASGLDKILFNAPVLIALVLCLYPVRKNAALKVYVALAISHYLLFYPWEAGLR